LSSRCSTDSVPVSAALPASGPATMQAPLASSRRGGVRQSP
jgi:hypothetical protein